MPYLDDFLPRFIQYLLAITTIIALLVVGEWQLGVMLTSKQPEDCIAVLLNRN
jgi:hypothetical protein